MPIPPTPTPTYPNVPQAPGVPPVLRQVGAVQADIVGTVADAVSILQLFQAPRWGIYDQNGQPVLASFSTIDQVINSVSGTIGQIGSALGFGGGATFACSVGSLDFRQDYTISTAPQEQGAFLSYNKVQRPFDGKVTFLVGGTSPQRAAFLTTVASLAADLKLFALTMPEIVYPSVNVTHYDFRRTARNGVSLLAVDVWVEEVRVTGTTAFSNTATPSGADPANLGTVQPLTPSQNSLAGSTVPAGGLT